MYILDMVSLLFELFSNEIIYGLQEAGFQQLMQSK